MSLVWENRQEGKPGTHLLIIGVGSYSHFPNHSDDNPVGLVNMCAWSAFEIAKWFVKNFSNLEAPLQSVRLLISDAQIAQEAAAHFGYPVESATVANVQAAFYAWADELAAVARSNAVFYFAGHGFGNSQNQSLLMEDYNANRHAALQGAVNYLNLLQAVNAISTLAGAWFFVDACRTATLAQNAESEWGVKFVNGPLFFASPVACFELFAAGSGRKALGFDNQPTFFAQALIQALQKNGYADDKDGWAVKAFSLHGAVTSNLEMISLAAEIPAPERQRADARIPDHYQTLHYRTPDNPPEFLVKISCDPEDQNALHELSYGAVGSNVWVRRGAQAGPWCPSLIPGSYQFRATNEAGKFTQVDKYIQIHFVEVFLKGAV